MASSSIVHDFFTTLPSGARIFYHVIKLTDSFFVWIGNETASFDSLAVGVRLQAFDDRPACSTRYFGDQAAEFAESISLKLTNKTNRQVFVSSSYSTVNTSADDLLRIEVRLFEEVKSRPEKFV